MKNLEQCKTYFNAHLKAKAIEVEAARQSFVGYWGSQMKKVLMIAAVAFIAGMVLMSYLSLDDSLSSMLIKAVPFLGPFAWVGFKMMQLGFQYMQRLEIFRHIYRQELTKPMLKHILPNVHYQANEGIDISTVESSMIVPLYYPHHTIVNKFEVQTHDLIQGNFAGLEAKASMVSLEPWLDRNRIDPLGGVFFMCKLSHDVQGQVVVRSEKAERLLGHSLSKLIDAVASEIQLDDESWYHDRDDGDVPSVDWLSLENIQMHHDEFEKDYRVRASNMALAEACLTDDMMAWMSQLATEHNIRAQFTYQHDYFYAYFFHEHARLFDVSIHNIENRVDEFGESMTHLYEQMLVIENMCELIKNTYAIPTEKQHEL
ncbi:MAG: DUF3137 domain-containing protein [Mariprofundaceae bacterium]|nr:DUF3137 domain-containing protein [Mariprofundaceae bacterium]